MATTTVGTTTVEAAIAAAVLDYFEGWFAGDVVRMQRAVHPQLTKRTLDDGARAAELHTTTADRMVWLTERGGGTDVEHDLSLDVEVVDHHHNIATVVVRSSVYREYLHLVHADGAWTIVNALWRET